MKGDYGNRDWLIRNKDNSKYRKSRHKVPSGTCWKFAPWNLAEIYPLGCLGHSLLGGAGNCILQELGTEEAACVAGACWTKPSAL